MKLNLQYESELNEIAQLNRSKIPLISKVQLDNFNYRTHRKKIRQRMLTNNPFKGKQHTAETKQKMRNAKLGRSLTKEQKKKIGLSNKGKGRIGNSVYCVELNKTFNSALEAESETNIPNPNIIQVCLGKRKTAGGYHWQYKTKKEK